MWNDSVSDRSKERLIPLLTPSMVGRKGATGRRGGTSRVCCPRSKLDSRPKRKGRDKECCEVKEVDSVGDEFLENVTEEGITDECGGEKARGREKFRGNIVTGGDEDGEGVCEGEGAEGVVMDTSG